MGVEPVVGNAHRHLHRQPLERQRVAHVPRNKLFNTLLLRPVEVEDKLVVHRQQQPRTQPQPAYLVMDTYHGNLDHVGRGALYGHVDSIALGERTRGSVARVDVGQIAAATEKRTRIAMRTGELFTLLYIGGHSGMGAEVIVYERSSLLARNAELLAEAESRNAVDDAEVDRLCRTALVGSDLTDGDAADAGRCGGVDILTTVEGSEQVLILRQRRYDTELYLRIVGGEDEVVAVGRHESAPYLAPQVGADGYVLQVGVRRRETPRGGDSLVVDSVQPVIDGTDELGQRVQIGGDELGEGAIVEYERYDGVRRSKRAEGLFGSGVLLGGRQRRLVGDAELLIKQLAELARRVDIQRMTCELGNLALDVVTLRRELCGIVVEGLGVDANAGRLHIDEHVDERQLNVGIELLEPGVAHTCRELRIQQPQSSGLCSGTDAVEGVRQFGVEQVVRQLHIKDVATKGSVDFSKEIAQTLEVEDKLGGGVVGKDAAQQRQVDVGDRSGEERVGVGGDGYLGALDEDGHIAASEILQRRFMERLLAGSGILVCRFM